MKSILTFTKKRKIDEDNIAVDSHSLRSSKSENFAYSTHCFLCETIAVDSKWEKLDDVYRVSSWNCQDALIKFCNLPGEKWPEKVKSKIVFADDLPTKDALYHNVCNNNFRSRRYIPHKYQSSADANEVHRNIGRPKDEERFEAFQYVINDFYENDDETVTISELIDRMREICVEPYSSVHMIRHWLYCRCM